MESKTSTDSKSRQKAEKRQLTQAEQADMITNEARNINARVIGFNEALEQAWVNIKQALMKRGYPGHPFDRFWNAHRKMFTCAFTEEQILDFASDVNTKLSSGAKNARDAKRQRDCNRGSIHANGLFLEMLRIIIFIFQAVRRSSSFPDREEVAQIVKFGLLAKSCEKEYRNMNESGDLTGITGRVFPKTALRLGFRQEIKKHWPDLIVKSDSRKTTQEWQDRCLAKYNELLASYKPNLTESEKMDVDDDLMRDIEVSGFAKSFTSSFPQKNPIMSPTDSFESSVSSVPTFMSKSMTQSLSSNFTNSNFSNSFGSSATSFGLPESLANIEIAYEHDIPDSDVNMNPIPPSINRDTLPPPWQTTSASTDHTASPANPSFLNSMPEVRTKKEERCSLDFDFMSDGSSPMTGQMNDCASIDDLETLLKTFHAMKENFCKMKVFMDQSRANFQDEINGLRTQVTELSSKIIELEFENQSLRLASLGGSSDVVMQAPSQTTQPHPRHQPQPQRKDTFTQSRKRRRVESNPEGYSHASSTTSDSQPQHYMFLPSQPVSHRQPSQLPQQQQFVGSFQPNVYDVQSAGMNSQPSEIQPQTYSMNFVTQPTTISNGAMNQTNFGNWGFDPTATIMNPDHPMDGGALHFFE